MRYLVYIGTVTIFVLLASCSDFLKEYSQDTYYVTSYEDLDELLVGDCYLPVQNSASSSNYGFFIHFLADELEEQNSYYMAWGGGSAGSLKGDVFGYYTWQQRVGQNDAYSGFLAENATWTETYRLINVANNIIASVKEVPQNSDEEKMGALRVKGEAHFLRATYYFWLANLYGKSYDPSTAATDPAVPIKTEEKVNDIKYSRNTVQEVYEQVLGDLEIAEECLSQTVRQSIYQADINAVNLLLSRVYLYMQNWKLASDYADKVLKANDYLIDLNDASFLSAAKEKEYGLAYTQSVSSIPLNQGVYLYGNPGTGKSYLMKGICNYYAKSNKSVSFVQVPLLIQELKQFMMDNEYRQRVMNHLRYSDVLVLDDIGAESITQWTRDEILLPILDERMNKGMKTYFTSNYSMEELEQQYRLANKPNNTIASLRILERIRTLSKPVELSGKSRR